MEAWYKDQSQSRPTQEVRIHRSLIELSGVDTMAGPATTTMVHMTLKAAKITRQKTLTPQSRLSSELQSFKRMNSLAHAYMQF